MGYIRGMKEKLKKEIGARLRMMRKSMGLTQAELVKHFDFGRANYCRMEKGEAFPNAVIMHTLKTRFNVSVDWIITGKGPMHPQTRRGRDRYLDFAQCEKELNELFDCIKSVPMVRHAIVGFFLEYKFKNHKLIRELLEELEQLEKQTGEQEKI